MAAIPSQSRAIRTAGRVAGAGCPGPRIVLTAVACRTGPECPARVGLVDSRGHEGLGRLSRACTSVLLLVLAFWYFSPPLNKP